MKFRNPFVASKPATGPAPRRPTAARLAVELLDDRVVPAALSIGDVTVAEDAAGVRNAIVTVTLSERLNKPVSVNYGTANGTATAGSDYAAGAGKLTFDKGETVKTILVPVLGDQVPEPTETFSLRLSNAKGASIADGLGIVTIADSSPRLDISTQAVDEGGMITFTVTLSAALDTPFTVDFATANFATPGLPYDAYAGQDYVSTSGTLTFAPGETTKTFTVQTLADDVEEYDEVFFVRLSNPSSPVFIPRDSNGYSAWGYIYGEYGPYG